MNRKLLAVAVVGALASPLAFAQNVTLYGGVDVGLQHADSGQTGAKNFVASGQWYTSRVGLKGSDDIGGGLYGLFQLEHGLKADTGEQADATFWTRTALAGLGNKAWGELTIGQQYTHMFNQANQLLATTLAGTINPAGAQTRANNSVKYSSASFSGFNFGALFSTSVSGNESATASSAGRYWDAHVGYAMKPFTVDFAHANLKDAVTGNTATKRNQLTGMWDNGAFGVFLGFATDKNDTSPVVTTDDRRIWIQPVFRFSGSDEIYGLYGKLKDKTAAAKDARWLGIAYRHLLSKRTYAYANWGQTKNDNGGKQTPFAFQGPAIATGSDSAKGIGAGVVVTF